MQPATQLSPPVHIPSRSRRSAVSRRRDHNFVLLGRVMAVILVGYLLFDRAFAWIHIPGTPVFVGEIALGVGLFVIIQTPHLGRLIRLSRPTQLLLLFMLWGFALAVEGFENWGIDAVRDSALWYYGLFALISSVMLLYKPALWDELVDRATRYMPAFFVIMVFRLAMAQASIGPRIPDSRTRLTAHKTADIAVNVAIGLTFLLIVVGPSASKELRQKATGLTLLGLLLVLAAGTQSRGGFLAAVLILTVVFFAARHARGAMLGVLVLAILVAILAAALDVKFQMDRRELSVDQVLENFQSVGSEARSGSQFDNTTQWRLNLWNLVVEDVFVGERVWTGFGFGENLALRYDYQTPDESVPLRNPHNSHLSVLARMGTVGMALWIAMFATWFGGLVRARRQFRELGEDRRAALSLWLMLAMTALLVNAFFDPTIEGPYVGIPLWSLFGVGAVLGMGARAVGSRHHRRRGRPQGDFNWLLLHHSPPVSTAHPSRLLDADLQEVVAGFDELLAEPEEEAGDSPRP